MEAYYFVGSPNGEVFYSNNTKAMLTLSGRNPVDVTSYQPGNGSVFVRFEVNYPNAYLQSLGINGKIPVNPEDSVLLSIPAGWSSIFQDILNQGVLPDNQQLEAVGIRAVTEVFYFS